MNEEKSSLPLWKTVGVPVMLFGLLAVLLLVDCSRSLNHGASWDSPHPQRIANPPDRRTSAPRQRFVWPPDSPMQSREPEDLDPVLTLELIPDTIYEGDPLHVRLTVTNPRPTREIFFTCGHGVEGLPTWFLIADAEGEIVFHSYWRPATAVISGFELPAQQTDIREWYVGWKMPQVVPRLNKIPPPSEIYPIKIPLLLPGTYMLRAGPDRFGYHIGILNA